MDQKRYHLNGQKLNILAHLCSQRIEDLLVSLEVNAQLSGNKYVGVCPIHGDSDNASALNIYYDGYSVPGYWKCRTKACQNVFGKTIIGFTRGRLSHMHMGYHWKSKPKAIYGFPGTLKYLCDFLHLDINDIKVDEKQEERRMFMAECDKLQRPLTHNDCTISRKQVRNSLIIPSEYFLQRGFDKNILDMYDVGLAKKSKIDTKNRVIVPIYNDKEYLIGYTCRSIFERCPKDQCKLFHNPSESCPGSQSERNLCSKWRHIGFNADDHLYNFWRAKQHIKNTNSAILVEGPGDVWKLEQNNIHNAVAMFGNVLSSGQERLLANAQCMSIIVLTDNDEAGQKGAAEIKARFGRLFNTYFPKIDAHDAGDLNEDAITENIKPYIDAARYI